MKFISIELLVEIISVKLFLEIIYMKFLFEIISVKLFLEISPVKFVFEIISVNSFLKIISMKLFHSNKLYSAKINLICHKYNFKCIFFLAVHRINFSIS